MSEPRDIHTLRRTDRARDDEWIRRFLQRAPFGYLATVADDQPFILPNLFVYDPDAHALVLHTARTGRTAENFAEGGRVAFCAAKLGRVLPASTALEFGVEYSGVVVFGRARSLRDPDDKRRALQLIMDKYAPDLRPGRDYRPITRSEVDRTGVHCVDITAWSGKALDAPPDFPGAFRLPVPPDHWFC